MAGETLTLRSITAKAVVAPLARPLRTAVGTIPAAPLVLIDLTTEEGVPGRAYVFGYMPAALGPLVSLVGTIGEELKGKPVVPAARLRDLDRRFRLLGWQGLVGMAVGGVDMALWDALGRAAGRPVPRSSAARRCRSRPMTAMARSIPSPTRRRCVARSRAVSARSRSSSATATSPGRRDRQRRARRHRPRHPAHGRLQPVARGPPRRCADRRDRALRHCLGRRAGPGRGSGGPRPGPCGLTRAHPDRRELVVPARHGQGHRRRGLRLRHARPHEDRRRHRLASAMGQAEAASIPVSSHSSSRRAPMCWRSRPRPTGSNSSTLRAPCWRSP